MKFRKLYFLIFFAGIFITSCSKFDKEISVDGWQPDISAPLLNGNFTVQEILKNFGGGNNVVIDPDRQVRVIYESEFFEVGSADLLTLVPPATFVLFDTIRNYDLNQFNNVHIDKILTKSGSLFYQIANTFLETIDVTLRVPQAFKNGETFSEDFVVSGVISQGNIDLEGWELRPDNDTVTFIYEAIKRSNGERVEFPNTFSLQFVDYEFSYVEGYLGRLSYEIPRDTVIIDFFDFFQGGSAFFEDPVVNVEVFNSIGIPIRAGVDLLQAVRPDGTAIPIGNVDLEDGIDFEYPLLNEVGETKITRFSFDKENSNIENIIGQPIDLVEYKVVPWANPDEDSTIIGFMTDSSAIGFSSTVELPFFGRADGFTVVDTFDLDLSNYQELLRAEFKTIIENGFPTDVEMQFYFANEFGVVFDSLINPLDNIILSAEVDNNGLVSNKTIKETISEINVPRMERLKQEATIVVVRASLTSLNNGQESVRVFADYNLDYRVGLRAIVDPE